MEEPTKAELLAAAPGSFDTDRLQVVRDGRVAVGDAVVVRERARGSE